MSLLSLRQALLAPALPRHLARKVMFWRDRQRSRAALARLEPHLLHDIGLDPRHAAREAKRPFWT